MNKTLDLLQEVSIKRGREMALREVLEIIDDWKMEGVETITMNGSAYEHDVETLKKMVAALKGNR